MIYILYTGFEFFLRVLPDIEFYIGAEYINGGWEWQDGTAITWWADLYDGHNRLGCLVNRQGEWDKTRESDWLDPFVSVCEIEGIVV